MSRLPSAPPHGSKGPVLIVEAQGNLVIEAELVLREIPVQVLLPAMLMDAAHAALECE